MKKKLIRYKFEDSQRKEIQSLRSYDNWHCWLAIAEDYLIIVLAVLMTTHISWLLLPVSLLIIGSRQRALATILHESAHNAFAKNKTLNHVMGTFFSGYLIIQLMSSYKASHVNKHHMHFGDFEKDPDYKNAVENELYKAGALREGFDKNFIHPLFLTKVPSYLKSLIQDRLTNPEGNNKSELLIFTSYWLLIISLTIATGTFYYFLIFWALPYITTFNIIGWFIELGEHYPLMSNNNTLYMTRNRHSHPIEKFITGMHNENYHLIHHLFPTIPYWNLPKAHEILMKDENYRRWDQESGGIFLSKNSRPSLIRKLYRMRCKKQEVSI